MAQPQKSSVEDELLSIEGMMDSWLDEAGAQAVNRSREYRNPGKSAAILESEDITSYVKSRKTRARHVPAAPVFARKPKVYGYQEEEPVRFAKAADFFPLLPERCREKGSWNNCTGNGMLPAYDWTHDPHCKKLVKSVQEHSQRRVRKPQEQPRRKPQALPTHASPPPPRASSQEPPPTAPSTVTRAKKAALNTGDDHCQQAQPSEMPGKHLEKLLEENRGLLTELANERSAKGRYAKRLDSIEAEESRLSHSLQDARSRLAECERRIQKMTAHENRRVQLLHALHQRETACKEILMMERTCRQKMRKLGLEDDSTPGDAAEGDNLHPTHAAATSLKHQARGIAVEISAARQKVEELVAQREQLQRQLSKLQQREGKLACKKTLLAEKLESERQVVGAQLQQRLTQELEQEVLRVRENNRKALRHRQREIEQQATQHNAERQALVQQLESAKGVGSGLTKELTTLRIATAQQKADLVDSAQLLSKQQAAVANLESAESAAKAEVQRLQNELSSVCEQLRVSQEIVQQDTATVESGHASVRKSIWEASATEEQAKRELTVEIAQIETEARGLHDSVATQEKALRVRQAAAATTAGKLSCDLIAARESAERTSRQIMDEKKRNQCDSEREDREIEELTNAMSRAEARWSTVNDQNVRLLQKLDESERLISMNNLS